MAEESLRNIKNVWMAPLTASENEYKRKQILDTFPSLSVRESGCLALADYLYKTPQRFYSRKAFEEYSDLLVKEKNKSLKRLVLLLNESIDDLDRAFLTLNEIGRAAWHDEIIDYEEYSFMQICDKVLHPAYLKLAEGVFHRLTYPVLRSNRTGVNKGTDDLLKLSACIRELQSLSCSGMVTSCNSVARNSIAHGRVTYRQKEVVYWDQKGNSTKLCDVDVVNMVDGLVDVCNGCALALKQFYLQHNGVGLKIPNQLMLEELKAEVECPWWSVNGCLISELSSEEQLVVYVHPSSRDIKKVNYLCWYTGVLAEYYAPGFSRYIISLRSPATGLGWAILDGGKLQLIRKSERQCSIEDYGGALESFFFDSRNWMPKFFYKCETFIRCLQISMPSIVRSLKKDLGLYDMVARKVEIHRNRRSAVVNGAIFLSINNGVEIEDHIRKRYRRIIRISVRKARRNCKWSCLARYLPLGYARISVYNTDRRQRQMNGLDQNLVCTVQINVLSHIRAPDIYGSSVEERGLYRIAWNKAWLESRE